MEKITLENEQHFLEKQYPKVLFKGRMVTYDPVKHQIEKGEAVCFLNIETGRVGKGFVKGIELSNPMKYAIYTIGTKKFMHHRVWPNVQDAKKIKIAKKKALAKLNRKDRKVLGV